MNKAVCFAMVMAFIIGHAVWADDAQSYPSQGFYVSAGPLAGSFRYYEGSGNTYGSINLPEYGYSVSLNEDPGDKGIWAKAEFSQAATGFGNEAYTQQIFDPALIQVYVPSPLPGEFLQEDRQQRFAGGSTYANFYLGYKFPLGNSSAYPSAGNLTVFGLGGYTKLVNRYAGGSATISDCFFDYLTCSPVANIPLSGSGTETFKSPAYGGGVKYELPLGPKWKMDVQAQYTVLPSVRIANDFAEAPSVSSISTSGAQGGGELNFDYAFSKSTALSLGIRGMAAGIKSSAADAAGFYYPGGGWNERGFKAQLISHF